MSAPMYIHVYIYIYNGCMYIYIYVYIILPTTVSGERKDDAEWGDLDEVDVTQSYHYSPSLPQPLSPLSPELSPEPPSPLIPSERSPARTPPRIDLSADDGVPGDHELDNGSIDDLPSVMRRVPEGFDLQPEYVMRDAEARGVFWCDYCTLSFPYRSQLHQHHRGARHDQMLEFLNGEPMYYCIVCNVLPHMPFLHRDGRRHRRNVNLLGRFRQETDVALRQVIVGSDQRRVAILLPPL